MCVSLVQLFETPWTIALQALLSMEFFRQEYWSGLPFPSPGDLTDPAIKPGSPALQADSLPSEPLSSVYHTLFFFLKLYIIVLVLPNIKMNPPQVYMRSPS